MSKRCSYSKMADLNQCNSNQPKYLNKKVFKIPDSLNDPYNPSSYYLNINETIEKVPQSKSKDYQKEYNKIYYEERKKKETKEQREERLNKIRDKYREKIEKDGKTVRKTVKRNILVKS